MTQVEKANRYDEIIEKAKSKIKNDKDHVLYEDDIIEIIPELKGSTESDDERIRKELVQFFKEKDEEDFEEWIPKAKVLAWFEKQGEQKPVIIIPQFRIGDVIRLKGSNAEYLITEISEGYYRGHGWCLDIIEGDKSGDYELVERKHSWSEEDETIKESIITGLEILKDGASDKSLIALYNKKIDWLKSLKDRYTWKPSKGQMDALSFCLKYVDNDGVFGRQLVKLYQNLKNLMED